MNSIFIDKIALIFDFKSLALILSLTGFFLLFIKSYYKEKEIRSFTEFHKKTTENIISGSNSDYYPFFKDDRLNTVENNMRSIEKYINSEKNIIIEDKHKLQTIISDISHQAKTPIANIKMINEILLSRNLDKHQSKEFIKSMDREVSKLDFLMQSMVTMSFLETGIMKFNSKVLPIYDTILSSLNSSMSLINEKEINIEVICSEDILVKHDPKWTAEAIYNVINNAAKFSPFKGNITIEAVQGQFYTSISIRDNGAGISNGNIRNIFSKFYSKGDENGSGIGLHLTERIIKGQNGYINVNSEINHGSEFILYLPND
ncbi:MAG: HAMP domain-containing histidine kinase [Gottschalkiaceae bacterium]|nr:MAG: HAMP domain-containing histidine kinase [Gottschalkiaceae bacterium]